MINPSGIPKFSHQSSVTLGDFYLNSASATFWTSKKRNFVRFTQFMGSHTSTDSQRQCATPSEIGNNNMVDVQQEIRGARVVQKPILVFENRRLTGAFLFIYWPRNEDERQRIISDRGQNGKQIISYR